MAALIGVDYLWRAMTSECFLQDIDRMAGFQGDRDLGGQYFSTSPINNCSEIDKPFGHGDIGRIQSPHLVGPIYDQAS